MPASYRPIVKRSHRPFASLLSVALLGGLLVADEAVAQPAGPSTLRAADDHLFAVMSRTRALRWDVAEGYYPVADQLRFCKRVDEVYEELGDLQRDLHRGRSREKLCDETADVQEALLKLRETLPRVAFAPGGRTCGTVDPLSGEIAALSDDVQFLHALIEGRAVAVSQPQLPIPPGYDSIPAPEGVYPPQTFGVPRETARPPYGSPYSPQRGGELPVLPDLDRGPLLAPPVLGVPTSAYRDRAPRVSPPVYTVRRDDHRRGGRHQASRRGFSIHLTTGGR